MGVYDESVNGIAELRTDNFSASELRCKCGCNEPHKMNYDLLYKLQELRTEHNSPLTLTSAYRCINHPNERNKAVPGQHATGKAVDILVYNGAEAYEIQKLAFKLGFTGIAYGNGFVHVDVRGTIPVSWRYA
jgi:zinc D-Ala-D-Ala carboxypeptidase